MKSVIRNASGLICFAVIVFAASWSVSAQEVSRGEVSWIVALARKKSQPPEYFCGGSVISSTFVLSAAQCFLQKETKNVLPPEDILAVFGAHDLNDHDENGRIALSPTKIIIHEDWDPEAQRYDADLALLQFDEGKIIISDLHIRAMYLWSSESDPPINEGAVVGWTKLENATSGQKNLPKKLRVPMQKNEECFQATKTSGQRTFCAGSQRTSNNESGVCESSRGSSLVVLVQRVPYLKGIMSASLSEAEQVCDLTTTAVYYDVFKYMDWIASKTRASNSVHCNFQMMISHNFENSLVTCVIDQVIDNDDYVFSTEDDPDLLSLDFQGNKRLQFLPRNIGLRLPNLMDFRGSNSNLTIVRDYYFRNLTRVFYMDLSKNSIATIEAGAFIDLIKTETLWLNHNKLETIDGKLFVTMTNLKKIHLNDNKLRVLSPTTFLIAGESLEKIVLTSNVCIDNSYDATTLDRLEADLLRDCQI